MDGPPVTYRTATAQDAEALADIHTESWRANYRGLWDDAYLDGPIVDDRRQAWSQRLEDNCGGYLVAIVAEDDEDRSVVGFAAALVDFDATHGTVVDNLHVRSAWQSRGIGRRLMLETVRAVSRSFVAGKAVPFPMYVHVLRGNDSAVGFYRDAMGGTVDPADVSAPTPYGTVSPVVRVTWSVEAVASFLAEPRA